jgi:hypothetical protein
MGDAGEGKGPKRPLFSVRLTAVKLGPVTGNFPKRKGPRAGHEHIHQSSLIAQAVGTSISLATQFDQTPTKNVSCGCKLPYIKNTTLPIMFTSPLTVFRVVGYGVWQSPITLNRAFKILSIIILDFKVFDGCNIGDCVTRYHGDVFCCGPDLLSRAIRFGKDETFGDNFGLTRLRIFTVRNMRPPTNTTTRSGD